MYVGISDNDLFVSINYLESTLSVVSVSNVASVLGKAFNEILTKSHQPADQVDLLTQRDLGHIQRWNSSFPQRVDTCVHDLVLQHAASFPQSPALCSWDGDITYRQLDVSSLRLARHFADAGISRDILAPVCLRKSKYAVIAMVAVLRAGGAFVPLDPSHPTDRLKAIIEKANAKIVIASPETAHLFQETVATIIQVSSSMVESLDPTLESHLPKVQPDHAAFVLFTSGSTGKPKGILQEHASVCTSSLAHGRAMNVTASSRVFQYAAFTFDVSMMDIFTTLIYGGCVCIPSEEDRMGNFTTVMNRMNVNWVLFTPSVSSLIKPDDVPSLETLAFGGEAVTRENITGWVDRVRLFNCYGPAECAACSIGEVTQKDSRPANIGRQLGAGLNWVVDPENHNRLLPIGAVGELLVEGPTLARGYLHDLAKTQDAFIKSPAWSQRAGPNRPRRIYKTGDLVRQNSDGTFDFVGRKDFQLKVRGQRVELGEVEYHLSTFPGIALSIALMPQSGPYSKVLSGVIQLHQQCGKLDMQPTKLDLVSDENVLAAKFDKEKLSRLLRSKLPSYMVPAHLLIVSRLPLSVSGKIDRKLVNAWLESTSRIFEPLTPKNEYEKDFLEAENVIALELCKKILSMVTQPGTKFFDSLVGSNFSLKAVALDSIQIISLIMFIRQRFGVKVHLDTLVDPHSTIRSVANSIESLVAGGRNTMTESRVDIMGSFQSYREEIFKGFSHSEAGLRNVFVTGATGFLGSRILYQLCSRTDVCKIVVHVRSQSPAQALQRIIQSAKVSGWWMDKYVTKLEAWTGDLAKPKLGLNEGQWLRLCGYGVPAERITTVIHNGATVNWNASFLSLKATNVDSTVELLNVASQSAALTDFVFVSGGQQLKIGKADDMDITEEVARSNGYSQTKFLSEWIVKEYALTVASSQQQVSVVKPGYIIGTAGDGIAIADDFIWRLAAGCLDIEAYNADDANSWLFVSDVDRVATAVSDCCCSTADPVRSRGAKVVKILDGLLVADFWGVIGHELGYSIRPLSSESWMKRIYKAIETRDEKHPLWPLLQTVEEGQGKLGAPCDPRTTVEIDEWRVKGAVKKSVEYLSDIGFLPNREQGGQFQRLDSQMSLGFARSSQVVVA